MTKRQKDALDPFARALAMLEELPAGHKVADGVGLRQVLAGVWPTMGDLRELIAAFKAEG